ncbi:ArsR/SmtB family transcription factor [Sinosporangium siamense]|nr:helix-turn-helix domain-containing protein [Sinosporangium siamense]
MEEIYHVTDPRTLKAVSHPLRVRMLGLLRAEGPATASELGRLVGESSGATSYHLRELAKYGFIEDDPGPRVGRERRWRAVHRYTSWSVAELGETPEGRAAVRAMRGRQLEGLVRDFEVWREGVEEAGALWDEALGMSDSVVELSAEGVRRLGERLWEVLGEVIAEDVEKKARGETKQVGVYLAFLPYSGAEGEGR